MLSCGIPWKIPLVICVFFVYTLSRIKIYVYEKYQTVMHGITVPYSQAVHNNDYILEPYWISWLNHDKNY